MLSAAEAASARTKGLMDAPECLLVTKAGQPGVSDRLRAGWADLGEGRWESARTAFDEALADGETPEAFEGLSWAAWWLDDAETVFSARELAYRLYRKDGNAASAARMATWLAADQLDFHGAWAVASGWLARAHRLLDPLEPGPDHGWLAFHEGFIAHANGDTATARERAALSVELGRRFGVADLEMLGLALDGAALVACAQVEEGMRSLDEATAAALEGEATIPISSAWTCCILVTACTPCSTTSAHSSGVTASPSSPSATGAATCLRSAAPSTASCSSGGKGGSRPKRSWPLQPTTTRARGPRGQAVL